MIFEVLHLKILEEILKVSSPVLIHKYIVRILSAIDNPTTAKAPLGCTVTVGALHVAAKHSCRKWADKCCQRRSAGRGW